MSLNSKKWCHLSATCQWAHFGQSQSKHNRVSHIFADVLTAVCVNVVCLIGYGIKMNLRVAKEMSIFAYLTLTNYGLLQIWYWECIVLPTSFLCLWRRHTQYPMLYGITKGAGSEPNHHAESIQVKVYSHLVYLIKSFGLTRHAEYHQGDEGVVYGYWRVL